MSWTHKHKPVKGCGHHMRWTERMSWCEDCGQSWYWIAERGWWPLPVEETAYGERKRQGDW